MTYPTSAMVASNADMPQPQAIGMAATKATNGATTNVHRLTRAAVDWVALTMGFARGNAGPGRSMTDVAVSALTRDSLRSIGCHRSAAGVWAADRAGQCVRPRVTSTEVD